MRRFVVAAFMTAMIQSAQAADLPDLTDLPVLRGPVREGLSTTNRSWGGYYVGGQLGYAATAFDFSNASFSPASFMLRSSVLQAPVSTIQVFGKNDIQSTSFGGFAGRNWQWEDAVLGVEANYNHMSKTFSSTANGIARAIVNPTGEFIPANHTYTHNVSLAGTATMEIQDVMTFRARAAWAAGDFLPYIFAGGAVARVAGSRTLTYNETLVDTFTDTSTTPATVTNTNTVYPTLTSGENRSNNFIVGYTGGLGLEYRLIGGMFARGEWEYIRFANYMDIKSSLNTVRVGVGYKF